MVEELKYLEKALTNHNYIQEETKSGVESGTACYHAMQSSSLLSKNLKIKIHRT
jgi:hypothetical protein